MTRSNMISRNSSLNQIKKLVRECLDQVIKEKNIFERNKGKGICERAIVFRFAHHLQNKFKDFGYFVDCDFNSSYEKTDSVGKLIPNQDGTETKRFIDIIIHKRNPDINNLICIEIKKWNNTNSKANEKDRNNLYQLTTKRGYIYGFHIIIHKTKSKWMIFRNDGKHTEEMYVFGNEKEIWQKN